MSKFFITTPIYYVNGEAHIGHAYTNTLADVIARYHRLNDIDTIFLTGTDEHGQKIYQSAVSQNISTQTFVDSIVTKFKTLWTKMNCQYDYFIRTTDSHHKHFVQNIWNKMIDKGYIYLGKYSGWYAVRDEAFYSETEIIDGKAPTGATVEWIEEPSYFFKLSAFQDKLLQFYEKNSHFVLPYYRFNEVKSFVKTGLRDLSISRIAVKWGIKVPNNEQHTIYVWLDALFNYMSALDIMNKNDFWPCNLHIVGKDILQFHAVYWPAFLMSLDIEPPKQILAHGWWKNNGEKMSKSLGNVLNPNDIIEEFGCEYMKYFMLREMQIGQDGSFSKNALINRINGELVNNIGNLIQRVIKLVYTNLSGNVLIPNDTLNEELLAYAYESYSKIHTLMQEYKIGDAIGIILEIGHKANLFIEQKTPWKLKNNLSELSKIMYILLECIRIIGILLQPFTPNYAAKILNIIYHDNMLKPFKMIHEKINFTIYDSTNIFEKLYL